MTEDRYENENPRHPAEGAGHHEEAPTIERDKEHKPSFPAGKGRKRKWSDGYASGEEFLNLKGEELGRYFYDLPDGVKEDGTPKSKPYGRVIKMDYVTDDGKKIRKFHQYHYRQTTPEPNSVGPGCERNWHKAAPETKIPYFLPQLAAASKDACVFIPEGEKDADSIFDVGLIATTCTGGVDGWDGDDLNSHFDDRICIILPDNDKPGRRFARLKRRNLRDHAARVAIMYVDPRYKDITEELEATYGADFRSNPEAKENLLRRAQFALALDELANLSPEEINSAKDYFCEQWNIGKRELNKLLKEYEAERKLEEREALEDSDEPDETGRKRFPVPSTDTEKTKVMELLDEALAGIDAPEPPMRDISESAIPVEVVLREPMNMHMLTKEGANSEEEKGHTRLPPPKTHMLVPHDYHSLALLIERHVQFYKVIEGKDGSVTRIPVALPKMFVEAYHAYRYSKLPRVGMVMTMPIVLPNGELLAMNGLDKKRRIVFRIEPGMVKLLPKAVPDDQAIKAAIRFLVDEWLCDVLMSFADKCIIITKALSILERAILPERPMYAVSAPLRGGGKTTLFNMIAMAILGAPAAATEWSNDEAERAKAIFSLLRQGVPFILFDNIPRGTVISCPTIEKISTSMEYTNRVLRESRVETVSCASIFGFTGNNIAMKGDSASRTLNPRIDVDQPDPENRLFKHPDPLKWTLDHRGDILSALYTIMLGNPRLRQPERERSQSKTRFKEWQQLIGSAVEYAAGLYGETIDFSKMFLAGEAEDEETSGVAELLKILDGKFADQKKFTAGDVRFKMENERDSIDTIALKTFFATPKGEDIPSSKTISSRLSAYKDTPTLVDGSIFKLRKSKEKDHTGTFLYWIERPSPDMEPM
jgi:hypothetical protein